MTLEATMIRLFRVKTGDFRTGLMYEFILKSKIFLKRSNEIFEIALLKYYCGRNVSNVLNKLVHFLRNRKKNKNLGAFIII